MFPVSTSQQRYGILAATKLRGQEFAPEDVELLRSLASHVAVALECALARDRAEQYQRELAKERDRLRLLLEINNHVVSKLDINDLFRSASASIRSYFGSDLRDSGCSRKNQTSFKTWYWIFLAAKGCWLKLAQPDLTDTDYEKLRTRTPKSGQSRRSRNSLSESLKAASRIDNLGGRRPIVNRKRTFGCADDGQPKADAFGKKTWTCLSQISIQISLALDNALAYGRPKPRQLVWKKSACTLNRKFERSTTLRISSERAPLSAKCSTKLRSSLRPDRQCSCMARPGPAKNCSPGRFTTSARVASALSFD